MIAEKRIDAWPGIVFLILSFGSCGMSGYQGFTLVELSKLGTPPTLMGVIGCLLLFAFGVFLSKGLFIVQPNEAKVVQFFGNYVGSVKSAGYKWVNPFNSLSTISLKAHTIDIGPIKVNDVDGNPIEIAAIVVWRVKDTARAFFEVQDYGGFVHVQSEAALRNLATVYPYDTHEDHKVSLRGHTNVVAENLRKETQGKMELAGIEIIDARISHLAYAPEIAHAMLQRQQASAIIAARQMIVDGAVGMVEMALDRLLKNQTVHFDEHDKAQMVSNLLVVLCSERGAQPTINSAAGK